MDGVWRSPICARKGPAISSFPMARAWDVSDLLILIGSVASTVDGGHQNVHAYNAHANAHLTTLPDLANGMIASSPVIDLARSKAASCRLL